MTVRAEPLAWAEQPFGRGSLGDQRRTRRLVQSAARSACHPEPSFPQVFDWNDLRGFYSVCHRAEATLPALPHRPWELTRSARRQPPLVLRGQDTSQMDFTRHPALAGTGPSGAGHAPGFWQHHSLAVVPQPRQVLGLAYQPLRVRQPAPAGETSAHRTLRQREADLWLEGLRASGQAPPDCCWVDGGDAAAASDEAMAAARTLNHPFRLRVAQDRLVLLDPKPRGPEPALRGYSRSWPSQGQSEGDIPSRGGRPARTAAVPRAAAPVWIPAPTEVRQRWAQPILEAWVIRVGQADPPADVQEPLEWLLGCSLPTVTRADINERRTWSSCRWRVEVFHDIEKNGCSEADRRFETAAAREACLAVLSVVAVHSFQLRGALENQPEAPAEQVATASEIAGVRRFSGHKKGLLTGRAFVRGVARRGGFLGRKGDGDPGVRSLWRGYQRLQDMIVGFHRHDSPKPDATG